jgi:hypothetical protein
MRKGIQMDDVQTPVEQTTEDTSSVPETNVTEVQETPVVELNDAEPEVRTVPYERFKEVNDRLKSVEERLEEKANAVIQSPVTEQYAPDLDPDSTRAVQHLANQVIEQREVATFMAKHATELQADPLLDAAMRVEFEKASRKGGYVDREALLGQAKAALDARMKPAQEAAKQAGIDEGRDIAKTKQQLGAVGETAKVVETDDSSLTAAELAKKYNLPVSN